MNSLTTNKRGRSARGGRRKLSKTVKNRKRNAVTGRGNSSVNGRGGGGGGSCGRGRYGFNYRGNKNSYGGSGYSTLRGTNIFSSVAGMMKSSSSNRSVNQLSSVSNPVSSRTGKTSNGGVSNIQQRTFVLSLPEDKLVQGLRIFIAQSPLIITNITMVGISVPQTVSKLELDNDNAVITNENLTLVNTNNNNNNNNSNMNTEEDISINPTFNNINFGNRGGEGQEPIYFETDINNTGNVFRGNKRQRIETVTNSTAQDTGFINSTAINLGIILLKQGIPYNEMVNNFNPPATGVMLLEGYDNRNVYGFNEASIPYVPENELLLSTTIMPHAIEGVGLYSHKIDECKSDFQTSLKSGDSVFILAKRGQTGLRINTALEVKIQFKTKDPNR